MTSWPDLHVGRGWTVWVGGQTILVASRTVRLLTQARLQAGIVFGSRATSKGRTVRVIPGKSGRWADEEPSVVRGLLLQLRFLGNDVSGTSCRTVRVGNRKVRPLKLCNISSSSSFSSATWPSSLAPWPDPWYLRMHRVLD